MRHSLSFMQGGTAEISNDAIVRFQRTVFRFYQDHGRVLPWRNTCDPYKILVSELMLQQTQVSRVITYYQRWMKRWPTVDRLAGASSREVLQAWMGLGYNSRALRLLKAACIITHEFKGDVIEAMHHPEAIPGVGRYTSQAVLIFATNADLVTVDTNIRRIFIHAFNLPVTISDKMLWDLAKRCLPRGRSRDWHNALMDYGALHLTAHKTGIQPKTKQTRYEGSDRQLRASIIRLLLQKNMRLSQLQKSVDVETSRLTRILDTLLTEGIIQRKNDCFCIRE